MVMLSRKAMMAASGGAASSLLTGLRFYYKLDQAGGTRPDEVGDNDLAENTKIEARQGFNDLAPYLASIRRLVAATPDGNMSSGGTGLDFTIACKALLTAKTTGFYTLIGKWDGNEYFLDYAVSTDRFRFTGHNGTGSVTVTANAFGAPTLNVWYTIYCGYNVATGRLFIEVNGSADTAVLASGIRALTGPFALGARPQSGSFTNYANGLIIDNVGGWGRLLTTEEETEYETYEYPWGTTTSPAALALPGVWTWFNNPVGLYHNGKTYWGSINKDGNVTVTEYTHVTEVLGAITTLKTSPGVDDHNNPTLLIRDSDKRLIAWYSAHNGADIFQRVSTNPEDASAWDSETGLSATLGLITYTYPNPVQLLDETDDPIYLFFRSDSGSGLQYFFAKSTDGGATWAAATKVWNQIRPYNHIVKNGEGRIDFAVNTTHPNVAINDLYHCYYEGGSWFQTNGTLITATPPFDVSSGTLIYDASANGDVRCWTWDIAIDGSGHPVIVYATFPDTETDHRYRYARWNGTSWDDNEITPAGGGYLYAAEEYYSAGVCLDHTDPNVVYLSKKVAGIYQIHRYTTSDGGSSWTAVQLTNRAQDCLRPRSVRSHSGSKRLLYWTGVYSTFTDFNPTVILDD